MLLVANQLKIKVLAVVIALALVMPMVMMPVGAAQAQENCPWAGIEYLDAEIKVIDGQPVFVYETETGYEEIPFSLSELGYAYADGQKMPLQIQGNSILVPTEEGPVAVPIEEFCVVMVDGEVMLLAEENPVWKIFVGKLVFKVAKKYVKHVKKKMAKDGITEGMIRKVLRTGTKMKETRKSRSGEWVVWRDNIINGKGVAVVLKERDKSSIVTVFAKSKKDKKEYLDKGQKGIP